MQNDRLFRRAARLLSRGGFTLVELLVVIGIIAILAGVALGPITRGITQAKENGVMQVNRQIGLADFAYSNDNNQLYAYGAKSETIANLLLNGNYITDPSIFYVAGTGGASKPSGLSAPYSLAAANVCFDFTVNNTGSTGLNSSAADGTPLCQLTGGTISSYTGGASCTVNGATAAFGTDGLSVTYKSNSAKFMKATITGTSTGSISNFIDPSYNDPAESSYGAVTP